MEPYLKPAQTTPPLQNLVKSCWNPGGTLVVEMWWNPGGTLVKPWWNPGGTWWNLSSGSPRTTPEPIWAETPKLSAVGEKAEAHGVLRSKPVEVGIGLPAFASLKHTAHVINVILTAVLLQIGRSLQGGRVSTKHLRHEIQHNGEMTGCGFGQDLPPRMQPRQLPNLQDGSGRGVGESGSRGVGESGSQGVGESGSRGVRELDTYRRGPYPESAFKPRKGVRSKEPMRNHLTSQPVW